MRGGGDATVVFIYDPTFNENQSRSIFTAILTALMSFRAHAFVCIRACGGKIGKTGIFWIIPGF